MTIPGGAGADRQLTVTNAHETRSIVEADLLRFAERVLRAEGISWSDVSVVLTDHEQVHKLNREYLGHDYETDVLSFPLETDRNALEGEVYIDLDTADENATRFGTTYLDEVFRYVVHGLLHLAGHDDATDPERAKMSALEDRYLALFRTEATDTP